jgi:alpha-L-rhamnosidase
MEWSRREFLKTTTLGSAALITGAPQMVKLPTLPNPSPEPSAAGLNLTPASWIWYPSGRTLPNTFSIFRTTFDLPAPPQSAMGWVSADSRYILNVNGTRLQRGPAPCDPRYLEADPVDCAHLLRKGQNALGATVLFYGHGDGTSPLGKPGFIFLLNILCTDGTKITIVSDSNWQSYLATSWQPGRHQRWYLRSLQEEFDARAYPFGWDHPEFVPSEAWLPAMTLNCGPDKPPLCSTYPDNLYETSTPKELCFLRSRQIPPITEQTVFPSRLAASHSIAWKRSPEEYFDVVTPAAYTAHPGPLPAGPLEQEYRFHLADSAATALIFEFPEEIVGYPAFTINAPEGTKTELLVHEGHAEDGPALLNTHFHSWSRFICRQGENSFEAFDYEAVKWLQLHVHGGSGEVRIRNVHVQRRLYPWTHQPRLATSDEKINKLIAASTNTLLNSAQETIVDGMGRERQQYSGDCGHQLHGIFFAFGDTRLPARFITTFSGGITLDGYFFDCWPAYDRLARVMERQLGMTPWGPILDHSIGFVFDCYYYLLYSGDTEPLREAYPRLQRFVQYLHGLRDPSTGLLPVTNLGLPSVWIDHDAYRRGFPHHKQCAFNLYASAMLTHAFPTLAEALGDPEWGSAAAGLGREILKATQEYFWDPDQSLFIVNRPWLAAEHEQRMCDRSLATALLFDQCPGNATARCLDALATVPQNMGLSYPANAGWRLWALAKGRRIDVVLRELRERWWPMESVQKNNSLSENWRVTPDSGDIWSHCPVAPLYVTAMSIAGVQPIAPGWRRILIHPQPGDLTSLDLTTETPHGPLSLTVEGSQGIRKLSVTIPADCEGGLVLDRREKIEKEKSSNLGIPGTQIYRLTPGSHELNLLFT